MEKIVIDTIHMANKQNSDHNIITKFIFKNIAPNNSNTKTTLI